MVKQFGALPIGLRGLIFVLVVLGIFFRVVNLDGKVYWHDEVFTSIRAAGYVGDEIESQIFNGTVLSADDLLIYQRLNPEKGIDDTLYALTTHPEHPPLYYLMVRGWMELFGSSVTAIRSLSVLSSLLTFPALYWLCLELFGSARVGGMAIALFAVSPFHILYAQEARHYSLWTLVTVLSCAALLRAMRGKTWQSWGIYTLTLILSFYTSLFSALVVIAHGICVLASDSLRWTVTLRNFLIAGVLGAIAFTPWLAVLVGNWFQFRNKTGWTEIPFPPSFLLKLWGLHLSSNFIDPGLQIDNIYTYIVPPLTLILVGYALYYLRRTTPRRAWVLIFSLIGITALVLILPDLIWGGRRSSQTRYFVPLLTAAQLAVAFLLSQMLIRARSAQQWIWQSITVVVITAGVVSGSIIIQADTWWSKVVSYSNPAIASVLNQMPAPLVISSTGSVNMGNVISLSYLVEPTVKFQLVRDPNVPDIPEGFSHYVLFYPTETLIQRLQEVYNFTIESFEDKRIPLMKITRP
ncbi:MAG: glycosyltransferase family 39 protein [Elainellaceae cyanobacterium]